VLGGEQSGHVIIRKYATTGDGILTAIMLTEELCDTKSTLSELVKDVRLFPQKSTSVRVKNKRTATGDKAIIELIEEIREELLPCGRLLFRESGTEPKIRIMIEAESIDLCDRCINRVLHLLRERGHIDE